MSRTFEKTTPISLLYLLFSELELPLGFMSLSPAEESSSLETVNTLLHWLYLIALLNLILCCLSAGRGVYTVCCGSWIDGQLSFPGRLVSTNQVKIHD